ncbi:hypothetical protein pb186bvf_012939 [Paramecium bursaria]
MLTHLSKQELEQIYNKKHKHNNGEFDMTAQELRDFNNRKPEDTQLIFEVEQDSDEDQNLEASGLISQSVTLRHHSPKRQNIIYKIAVIGLAISLIYILNQQRQITQDQLINDIVQITMTVNYLLFIFCIGFTQCLRRILYTNRIFGGLILFIYAFKLISVMRIGVEEKILWKQFIQTLIFFMLQIGLWLVTSKIKN